MTCKIPPLTTNIDCLENLIRFLSLKDRARFRVSSKDLKSQVRDIPIEAKKFTVFASELPRIQDIIQRTQAWDKGIFRARVFEKYVSWADITNAVIAVVPIMVISSILHIGFTADEFFFQEQSLPRLQDHKRFHENLVKPTVLISVAITIALLAAPCLINAVEYGMEKSALRPHWNRYRNQPEPLDIVVAGHQLRGELEKHQRLSAAYAQADGIDKYYNRY